MPAPIAAKLLARIGRFCIPDRAKIDDVISPISRRGGVHAKREAVTALSARRHGRCSLRVPRCALISALEKPDWVGNSATANCTPTLHARVEHLNSGRIGWRRWRRQINQSLTNRAVGRQERCDRGSGSSQNLGPALPTVGGLTDPATTHACVTACDLPRARFYPKPASAHPHRHWFPASSSDHRQSNGTNHYWHRDKGYCYCRDRQ